MVNISLIKQLCLTVALTSTAIPVYAADAKPATENESAAAKVGDAISNAASKVREVVHSATAPAPDTNSSEKSEKTEVTSSTETTKEVKDDGKGKEVTTTEKTTEETTKS